MVGVKHKQFFSRFYSAFSIITLMEIMFIKFADDTETAGVWKGRISLQNDLEKQRNHLK